MGYLRRKLGRDQVGHPPRPRLPARATTTPTARPAPPPASWPQRLSLRTRLMIIGLLGVAGALVIGGVALDAVLVTSLSRTVHGEVRASAQEVASLVDAGRLPEPVPVSGAEIVQILDAGGRVTGGSLTADRLTPLVTESERRAAVAGKTVVVPANRAGLSGELQVAAVEAGPATAGSPWWPRPRRRRSTRAAGPCASSSSPCCRSCSLVLGLVAWRVIGAALRPVEALRLGAERIDEASHDDERLPVPPTRRRDRRAGNDAQRDVEPGGRRAPDPAGLRRRRRPRAAQPAGQHADPARGRPAPRRHQRAHEWPARRGPAAQRARRGLAPPCPDRRHTPARPVGQQPVAEVLRSAVDRYAAAHVPVRLTLGAGVGVVGTGVVVAMDARDLTRAVTNLVDNAVRHTASRVDVSASVAGRFVRIVVTDDGAGIPEADRERVFDRFTRLDDARDRDSGGTGLGLAITRQLVTRAGGTVSLGDRNSGPGLAVTMTLPLGQPVR